MSNVTSMTGGRGMAKSLREPRLASNRLPFALPRRENDPSCGASEQPGAVANGEKQRRLAAILAADVAGYSRLVGADELGTLTRLQAHWDAVVEPTIKSHDVRIVRIAGDGILAEFASVVDAVQCAVKLQRGMAERNVGIAAEERIEFRMGINVGDILIDRGDMWGDGVNVAARLEALATPGGICVSGRVHEDVQGKLSLAFEDTGEHRLKNIARPVRVYRIELDEAAARTAAPSNVSNGPQHQTSGSAVPTELASGVRAVAFRHRLGLGMLATTIVLGAAATCWWLFSARHDVQGPAAELAAASSTTISTPSG